MPGLNIATILSYVLAVAVGVLIYFVYAKLNISKANVSAQRLLMMQRVKLIIQLKKLF